MTIQLHMDNLKQSLMEQSVLDNAMRQLNDVFRTSKKELLEKMGPIHEYLGLTMNYSKKNQVMFTLYNYFDDIIGTATLDMNGTAPNPGKASLFTVDKSSPFLNVKGSDFFCSTTARLLFTAKRARPDI